MPIFGLLGTEPNYDSVKSEVMSLTAKSWSTQYSYYMLLLYIHMLR